MATEKESKLEAGVPNSKLKVPPKSCMPRRAKMRMKRKRRRRRDTMDFMEASRETTRFLKEDQYLEQVWLIRPSFKLSLYSLGDLEDPEKPEGSEDREAEGTGLGLEVGPDNLKDTAAYHKAVEPDTVGGLRLKKALFEHR